MPTAAVSHFDVSSPPATAGELVVDVLRSKGYIIDDEYQIGAPDLRFTAKRKVLRCKLVGKARITSLPQGARIDLTLDIAPGEPSGLLDERRNRKSVDELQTLILERAGAA